MLQCETSCSSPIHIQAMVVPARNSGAVAGSEESSFGPVPVPILHSAGLLEEPAMGSPPSWSADLPSKAARSLGSQKLQRSGGKPKLRDPQGSRNASVLPEPVLDRAL